MSKQATIVVLALLAASLLAFVAKELRRSNDTLLKITRTSFPSCQTRSCIITPRELTVTTEDKVLSRVRLDGVISGTLLQAIRNTPLSTLKNLYEDTDVADGFELEFQFHLSGKTRTIEARNYYVRDLYRILEECNKILPSGNRFPATEYFVEQNERVDRLIAQYRANTTLPEELREKAIDHLQKKKVKINE